LYNPNPLGNDSINALNIFMLLCAHDKACILSCAGDQAALRLAGKLHGGQRPVGSHRRSHTGSHWRSHTGSHWRSHKGLHWRSHKGSLEVTQGSHWRSHTGHTGGHTRGHTCCPSNTLHQGGDLRGETQAVGIRVMRSLHSTYRQCFGCTVHKGNTLVAQYIRAMICLHST
jgi:hypothetical protein